MEQLFAAVKEYLMPSLSALVIIFIAFMVAAWLSMAIKRIGGKSKVDETLIKFFAKMSKWAVLLIAALFILGKFGIETASFSVILGAMGLAIGLAFQGSLSNIASGTMLMIFRPFKVGDVIKVSGVIGKVDEIEMFVTTLDTPDNRRIIVPNSTI
jgi:small conductance mechanosensitive channel